MADPEGMEAEGERVREVGRMEGGAGQELRSLCGGLEECSVCHACGCLVLPELEMCLNLKTRT